MLTPDAKLLIAIIGTITLTMGALIATAQSDIKKVLAFSTLSQLGYMMLAMGIGSWVGGLFHLITHAFFKSLLFLAAGSVIHAAGHEQEMPQFGGLLKKIPVTGVTFLIAVLAIAGAGIGGWGFSGYYSKDMILAHAGRILPRWRLGRGNRLRTGYFSLCRPRVAYLTAFYMMRCWTLTFWGKPRNQAAARCGTKKRQLCGCRWSRWRCWRRLAEQNCSGIRITVAGFHHREAPTYCQLSDAQFNGFAIQPGRPMLVRRADRGQQRCARRCADGQPAGAHARGHELVDHYVAWAFADGNRFLGFAMYCRGYGLMTRVESHPARVGWIHEWLYRRMYFDELYQTVFVAFTAGVSMILAALDRVVVDGAINGIAWAVGGLSDRRQPGRIARWLMARSMGSVRSPWMWARIARTPQAAGRDCGGM